MEFQMVNQVMTLMTTQMMTLTSLEIILLLMERKEIRY